MHRRTYLTALVGTATLAGCLDRDNDSDPVVDTEIENAGNVEFRADQDELIRITVDVLDNGPATVQLSSAKNRYVETTVPYYREWVVHTTESGTQLLVVNGDSDLRVRVQVEVTSDG